MSGTLYIFIGVIILILASMVMRFISLWFQALVSGSYIPLFNIVGMSMRKIPPRIIVNGIITLSKAGIKGINTAALETHYLASGSVTKVISAMIVAQKANIPLSWGQATAIDLAGRDILEAVRTSVNPKVINCPSDGTYITAVSKDGIQLGCRARVTVRTNLQQLVGGATEETIIARVGEGIINSIGAANQYVDVLEAPQSISKLVLEKGSMRRPHSKSSPSISPTSMLGKISELACAPTKPNQIRKSHKPKLKRDERMPLLSSRRTRLC